MFQLPNEFHVDPDDMHYAESHEEHCGWCLLVLLTVSAAIVVMAAVYVWQGIGLAALLPGIVDHQSRERRLFKPRERTWLERFDEWKDRAVFFAIALFVVLFVTGVLK